MISTRTRNRLLVPIVGMVAALGIAACGDDDETTSADTAGDERELGG